MAEASGTAGWRWLWWEVAAVARTVRSAVREPGPERDTVVQSLKAAGAAVMAWALTGWWLNAPLALMAPWTAVALVDATVYRSLRSGLQQLVVIVLGAVLASAVMAATGGSKLGSMLIVLPVMTLVGTHRRLGAQGIYGATTALFVITYGAYSLIEVEHRLVETMIGAVIGIAVNAFVLPPVHLRNVHEQLSRLPRESAELLRTMAEGLRGEEWSATDAAGWHDRARRLGQVLRALASAREWNTESSRFNPGFRLRRTGPPPPPPEKADAVWERAAAHLAAITRTLAGTVGEQARLTVPGAAFLRRYADLADEAATLCKAEADLITDDDGTDAEERYRAARERAQELYDGLADDFRAQRDPPAAAASGELLVEMQQLLHELTHFAESEAPQTEKKRGRRSRARNRDGPEGPAGASARPPDGG
ncbi:aromatic acid exporter family protein [Streptomyces sp. NPDC059788]|uniref:FUSC family protein n=1 Tax=Streptomyces sp. NPDC059788 TaxID=3346948 RepID=UPI003658FAF2